MVSHQCEIANAYFENLSMKTVCCTLNMGKSSHQYAFECAQPDTYEAVTCCNVDMSEVFCWQTDLSLYFGSQSFRFVHSAHLHDRSLNFVLNWLQVFWPVDNLRL